MEHKDKTLDYLKDKGYTDYYPDYSGLPSMYCSFYISFEPDFFLGWIQWPYTPWDDKIIPAKYRWDSHDPQWGYNQVPYAINQGWDDYTNLCGPPNYEFKNENWQDATKQYLAMNEILLSNSQLTNNNNMVFHAENKVVLETGTVINGDNSQILFKAGNVCDGKQGDFLKYSIYSNVILPDNFEKSLEITNSDFNTLEKEWESKFSVFPNPSTGREFFIKTNFVISYSNIAIFDVLGNNLEFKIYYKNGINRIVLLKVYTGIVFIRYFANSNYKVVKLIFKQ